jgi:hypothetical protein
MKSFLEMACHCDIYDLFDDALFDTIALDPGEWLQQFTKDSDVKIIIISSIGTSIYLLTKKEHAQVLELLDNILVY